MASHLWNCENESEEFSHNDKDLEDLYVFGYACKLFRDDEKALFVDEGKHLIPWMGNDKLMIDRYDGRGHLYDLPLYDADNIKSDNVVMTEAEKRIEEICEEERYLELHTDLREKAVYEEEEWKRYYESLSDGYQAVGFSYDEAGQPYIDDQEAQPEAEEDDSFVVPEELCLSPNIKAPTSKKQNAIIEKTASFIARSGPQMEIMLKTKQHNNDQFSFLNFESEFNFYYKHMVKMIKAGKYKPQIEEKEDEHDHDNDDHHSYLHPSLMPQTIAPVVSKPVPQPKYSIHDTAYGQLLKSITSMHSSKERGSDIDGSPSTSSPHILSYIDQEYSTDNHGNHPPPPGLEPVTLPPNHSHLESDMQDEFDTFRDTGDGIPHTVPQQIIPPAPDIQPVIDRMAQYVAKNGIEFEIVVKSKNDPRFEFLKDDHVHFLYYSFKKDMYMKEAEKERERERALAARGVSFSIKTKSKEQESKPKPKEKRRIFFDYDSSGDENDGDSEKGRVDETSNKSSPEREISETIKSSANIDEKKIAEEKLKDRLTHAAREKVAHSNKEKQVQTERKKKAAMFVNMLKVTTTLGDYPETSGEVRAASPSHSTDNTENGSSIPQKITIDYHHGRKPRSKSKERSRKSRRSQSKSPKRRKKRSPTPPSAYARVRRSPPRWKLSRSPPRYRERERERSPLSPRYSRNDSHRYHSRSKYSRSRSRSRSKSRKSISPSKEYRKSRESRYDKESKSRSSSKRSKSPSRSSKDSKSPSRKTKSPSKSRKSRSRSPVKKKRKEIITIPEEDDDVIEVTSVDIIQSVTKPTEEEEEVIIAKTDSICVPGASVSALDAANPQSGDDGNESPGYSDSGIRSGSSTPVSGRNTPSQQMVLKIRAMLKASREAIAKEDALLDDS